MSLMGDLIVKCQSVKKKITYVRMCRDIPVLMNVNIAHLL